MSNLKIALPNKGRLYQDTLNFLKECGLGVIRDNERQYQSRLTGLFEDVEVVFQRALDIPKVVGQGQADLGITGLDIFCEMGEDASGCVCIFPDRVSEENQKIEGLPFGFCALVLAVPDQWVDITSISDLVEFAITRKKEGRMLRVATEFPHLTKNYLFQKNVTYFEITEVSGAVESAPAMGSADIVSDLISSGVTLTENRLKLIDGGKIIQSQASLIASLSLQKEELDSKKMSLLKQIVDRIEAHLNAKKYSLIIADIKTELEEGEDGLFGRLSPLEKMLLSQETSTILKVINLRDNDNLYSIRMKVKSEKLNKVVSLLQKKGGQNIIASSCDFIYDNLKAFPSFLKKISR